MKQSLTKVVAFMRHAATIALSVGTAITGGVQVLINQFPSLPPRVADALHVATLAGGFLLTAGTLVGIVEKALYTPPPQG
jgi:hypothetical protein